MRLYLAQHGDAVAADVDPARPLSPSGWSNAARTAAVLAGGGVRVGRTMHSGKRRAEQTAEILAAALGGALEARAGLGPNHPTAAIAREAGTWEDDVMLVGHLPFMAKLASRLTADHEDAGMAAFRPGAVVCLERSDQQRWAIAWMIRPELVPASPTISRSRT